MNYATWNQIRKEKCNLATIDERLSALEGNAKPTETSNNVANQMLNNAIDSVKKDVKKSVTNIVVGKVDENIVTAIMNLPVSDVSDDMGKEAYRTVRRYLNWVYATAIGLGIISYFKIKAYIGAPATVWNFVSGIFG